MGCNNAESKAIKVSFFSIIVNLLLSLFKLFAGIMGHSQALVADAVHSASDVFSTVIVLVSLFVAGKSADSDHEYGHQKYENLATLALALILGYVGIKLGISSCVAIVTGNYKDYQVPTFLTIVAAAVSVFTKEAMYRITMVVAKKENSSALKADAWHHRSDALSSVGSLAGVIFAMFGLLIMDSIAGIIICIFILKTAVDITIVAIKGLTDSACDEKTEDAIRKETLEVNGVICIDSLKTRIFGSGYYVDIEIQADGAISLEKAHEIAENVHDRIEETFPLALHCMVHVNPAKQPIKQDMQQ